MDNTPISAVTLPNNNRHLYFPEQTGAIRQAAFSSSAQYWQTTIDARLPENARNNTPIAVMPTDLSEISTDVVLLYVNSTDQLDCVEWQTTNFTSANKFNLVCGKPLLNSANDLSSNNIGATYLGGVSTSPHLSFESAGEAAPFAMDNGFGGLLSIHNSSLQSSDRSLPPPKNTIPYDHIASTNSINSSKVYFHYQLNDATFVENLWDDTSGFWSPKNITNAT
ncbi:MAG: hypothetical protein L6R36_006089 [Xanthoria steineri]|nr:MAG: hypothetical protein L6R36_006089 [Xanthoria steineri]